MRSVFSSLAATEVVFLTAPNAATNNKIGTMATFVSVYETKHQQCHLETSACSSKNNVLDHSDILWEENTSKYKLS